MAEITPGPFTFADLRSQRQEGVSEEGLKETLEAPKVKVSGELIKLLDLQPPAEMVFRQELHRRTKNPEHAPLPGMVRMSNEGDSKNAQKNGKKRTTKTKAKRKQRAAPSSREEKEEEPEETAQQQFERIMREEAEAAKAVEVAAKEALLEESEQAVGRGKKKKKGKAKKKAQEQEEGDASAKSGTQVAAQAENEKQPKAKKKKAKPKKKKK